MEPEYQHGTFLGLDPEDCHLDDARVVLLPVPYDGTASYRTGARHGPGAILAASSQVELWDRELGREPWTVGIHTLPAMVPSAAGPREMLQQVQSACAEQHARDRFVFLIGGEHSITVGAARSLAGRHDTLSFLQIDAHLDLRDSYEGTRHGHASVGRRLLELGPLVHVGVRTACPEELEVISERGLRPIWGQDVQSSTTAEWIDAAIDQLGPEVYVSVDVDGLDPSVIPGTGTPVPGGLGWYDTLALLRAVGERRRVVGCDLCELAPIPGQVASEFAAALLVYKMVGFFVT